MPINGGAVTVPFAAPRSRRGAPMDVSSGSISEISAHPTGPSTGMPASST